MLANIVQTILNVFRFHKKKIAFLFASLAFCFLVLFPYDDLSDFITLTVSTATQNNLYLQFDNLSFGLIPQLALVMDKAVIESVWMPTLELNELAIAPKFATIFGSAAGKLRVDGLYGGSGFVDLGPSNELEIDGDEYGVEINLERVNLKQISKILKQRFNSPVSLTGSTGMESTFYVDPRFKAQPKGEFKLNIKKLEIPAANIPINQYMSYPTPALKLEEVQLVGQVEDGTIIIREGKIGEAKNDVYGTITGDMVMSMAPGGRVKMGGYNIKLNLNISESFKRQLGPILLFVDGYKGIGEKYKFNSLRGVRYSMRLQARSLQAQPDVFTY